MAGSRMFSFWPPKIRILVIDDFAPEEVIGAGAPRAVQLLRALCKAGAQVTLFPTLARPDGLPPADVPNVIVENRRGGKLAALASYLQENHGQFDAILISRRHNLIAFNQAVAGYPQIAISKFIIFDSEAVFAAREALQRSVLVRPVQPSDMTIAQEVALSRRAHMVIAVNEIDAALFCAGKHRDVRVLGNAIAPALGRRPHAERSDFLFVGPTYADDTPNGDSVIWFVDGVLPAIRAGLGREVALSYVGKANAPGVLSRMDGRIDAHGQVPDATEYYSRARVFVAPTRFASGIPLKVNVAAAHGVPCVVTPLLARQLGWEHDREVLVAQTPEAFAGECLRLHRDAALWKRIREAAFARVTEEYKPATFDRKVAQICTVARKTLRRSD